MSLYAPISISVYDRAKHLKACIAALQQNPEAPKSVLYVFSDAPQPGDEDKIRRVREYIKTISGFLEVRAVFQEQNSFRRNMKDAREIPLKEFGRIIRMEDDLLVSRHFLGFMNKALDRYESDARIFAICGYTPKFRQFSDDFAFLSKDFSAWGFATWESRDMPSCFERRDYYSRICDKPQIKHQAKQLHPLLLPMLKLVEQGKLNPGDYKLTGHQFICDVYSLKPGTSLVKNIGFDGLGMGGNGAKTKKFDTETSGQEPKFPVKLDYDSNVDKELFSSYFTILEPKTIITFIKLNIISLIPRKIYLLLRNAKKIIRRSIIHSLAQQ